MNGNSLSRAATITFVVNSLSGGGAERLVVDEINECIRRGIPVRLITLRPEKAGASLLAECRIAESNRRNIVFRGMLDLSSWLRFVLTIREWRPRILVTHLWFANTIGRVAGAICRVPAIVSFEHNVYDAVKSPWQFFVDRMLQRFSDRIVAVSRGVCESLVRHGINRGKIVILLNGVDLSRIRERKGGMKREKFGVPQGAFLFFFIGRLTRQKGLDVLFAPLRDIPGVFLLVAGDGEERARLEALAEEYRLRERVRFLGERRDIPQLLSCADCVLLPSRWEGFGIAAVEAMAAGVPVIASDVGGFREIIISGTNGVLVPLGDVDAFKREMERMMRDAGFRRAISRNALLRARDFDILHHVDQFLTMLSSIEYRHAGIIS